MVSKIPMSDSLSLSYIFKLTNFFEIDILGITSAASEKEIKRAFLLKAKQYHPDVNKAPNAKEKFAEISSAYETLGDTQKKQMYDSTGMTGDEQNQSGFDGGFSGFDPFGQTGFHRGGFEEQFQDIFSDFFGGQRGAQRERRSKGENITRSFEIDFMTSVKGGEVAIEI